MTETRPLAELEASGRWKAPFPLTLTLSPRERESWWHALEQTNGLGFNKARQSVLPLPQGKGWGEGEGAESNLNAPKSTARPAARLRISDFGFVSDFDIRSSDFA